MSKTINFVQERQKTLTLVEEQDKQLLQKTIWVFVTVFGVFLVILLGKLFFSYQLDQVVADQKAAQAGILQQESVERDFSIFSHKLTHITELWSKRKNKQEAIAFFMNLFSDETSVSGISYSASTDALTFRLRADSVFVLEQALETLTSPRVLDMYPSITKDTLARSGDASYTLNVTVSLGSK